MTVEIHNGPEDTGGVVDLRRDQTTDSWITVVGNVSKLAGVLARTEFVPKGLRGSTEATTAAMLAGRELGLPPMAALGSINVIEGKPSLTAEMMRGLVFQAGHEILFDESTSTRCVVRGRRAGSEAWTTAEFTIDQARQAGLLGKNNWKNDPVAMLIARATTRLCRMVFPDVLHGLMGVEEALDMDDETSSAAPVVTQTTKVTRAPRKTPQRRQAPAVPELPAPTPRDTPTAAEKPEAKPAEAKPDTPEKPVAAVPDLPTPEPRKPEPDPEPDEGSSRRGKPGTVTQAQLRMLGALWNEAGVTSDEDRRNATASMVNRQLKDGSTKDLSKEEASWLIEQLRNETEGGRDE